MDAATERDAANAIEAADAAYRPFPEFESWAGISVDAELWERYASLLDQERALATPESRARSTDMALRAAAIDSGAIEGLYPSDRGFTLSVAAQAAGWEVAMDERGSDVRSLFEAQLQAFEMVLDVATVARPITEAWIRELHSVACRAQRTYKVLTTQGWQEHQLPLGRYKLHPNHVYLGSGRVHAYAPVTEVGHEMERLVREVSSDKFTASHPILQASYIHYALVAIHPFADGNGRVARSLASVFLCRSNSIPLVIYVDQKASYFTALHKADDGNPSAFVDFILDRGIDTMAEVRWILRASRLEDPSRLTDSVRGLYTGYGGLRHEELAAIGQRLANVVHSAVEEQIDALNLPEDVEVHVSREISHSVDRDGYGDTVPPTRPTEVTLRTWEPATASVTLRLAVLVAKRRSHRFAFAIAATGDMYKRNAELLELRLDDVHPSETVAVQVRTRTWIRALTREAYQQLLVRATKKLRGSGYDI